MLKIGKSRTAEHFKPCFYQTYEELGRCTINGAPWSDAVSHEPSQCLIVIALAVVFVEQFGSCKHESLSAIANHTISYKRSRPPASVRTRPGPQPHLPRICTSGIGYQTCPSPIRGQTHHCLKSSSPRRLSGDCHASGPGLPASKVTSGSKR